MKQLSLILVIALSSLTLFACTQKDIPVTQIPKVSPPQETQSAPSTGKCEIGEVSIEGYGDKGKRLANCFVQYPGEPSRQDKSYYILEDICGQFTKEFIGNALGKPIIKAEPATASTVFACTYYTSDKDYVQLVLDYLKITNQKKGQEEMGRTTEENSKIPMKNLVVYQEDGVINSLYLVLGDEKFISIQRSSATAFTKDELLSFATNIGTEIKNYK